MGSRGSKPAAIERQDSSSSTNIRRSRSAKIAPSAAHPLPRSKAASFGGVSDSPLGDRFSATPAWSPEPALSLDHLNCPSPTLLPHETENLPVSAAAQKPSVNLSPQQKYALTKHNLQKHPKLLKMFGMSQILKIVDVHRTSPTVDRGEVKVSLSEPNIHAKPQLHFGKQNASDRIPRRRRTEAFDSHDEVKVAMTPHSPPKFSADLSRLHG